MAECTDAERALIDALMNGKGVAAARMAVTIERRPAELFETAVRAEIAAVEANIRRNAAIDAYCSGPDWLELREKIEKEAERRREETKAVQA